jgi:hypothetical protein
VHTQLCEADVVGCFGRSSASAVHLLRPFICFGRSSASAVHLLRLLKLVVRVNEE